MFVYINIYFLFVIFSLVGLGCVDYVCCLVAVANNCFDCWETH